MTSRRKSTIAPKSHAGSLYFCPPSFIINSIFNENECTLFVQTNSSNYPISRTHIEIPPRHLFAREFANSCSSLSNEGAHTLCRPRRGMGVRDDALYTVRMKFHRVLKHVMPRLAACVRDRIGFAQSALNLNLNMFGIMLLLFS